MPAEEQRASEARAFWSGTITFGLVSVPVDLYPAVRSHRIPLRMLGPEGRPLQRRYFCSADGEPLTGDDIVRGYEWDDGSFTEVSDEELEALAPAKSRDIDLSRFVPREDIPAELLQRPYVLAPSGESTKAYHLLAQTMERAQRAGIATFVMRGKEYLAAIFAEGGLLRAVTMRFLEELRTPEDVGLPEVRQTPAAERKAMEEALAKLEKKDIDTTALEDEYSARLLETAERKRGEGRDVVEVEEAAPEDEQEVAEVIDIMRVLKERVAGDGGSGRRPARQSRRAGGGSRRGAGGGEALARKSKKELYEQAKALDLPNRSRLSKDELIDAIRRAG